MTNKIDWFINNEVTIWTYFSEIKGILRKDEQGYFIKEKNVSCRFKIENIKQISPENIILIDKG